MMVSAHRVGIGVMTGALLCTGVICTALRVSQTGLLNSIDRIAAETVLPSGNYEYKPAAAPSASTIQSENSVSQEKSVTKPNDDKKNNKNEKDDFVYREPSQSEIDQYDADHEGEVQYPVLEFTSVQGNEAYGGVQIKNISSADIDIKEELEGRLGFSIENTNEPQVLIYHTHTSESFLPYDTGYYYESYYPRSSDNSENVCAVGDEIAKELNKNGIVTIHDTTVHDASYTDAYSRSYETVMKNLEKYPSIKVILDIHRDGIGTENSRSKPVCTVNGKKAAQFMILAGYNYDDDPDFNDWEYNLRFALNIQKNAVDMYSDLARPMDFGDFSYHMDICPGSLLIEVGSDSNSIEEVKYTGHLLGKVISRTLKNKAMGT